MSDADTATLTPVVLTADERTDLFTLEADIHAGLEHWHSMGRALAAVSERKLYREYTTFPRYVEMRWALSRSRAYQLIQAVEIVDELSSSMSTNGGRPGLLPVNERQARALATVPPEDRALVWASAVAKAHGQPTADELMAEAFAAMTPEQQAGVIEDAQADASKRAASREVQSVESRKDKLVRQGMQALRKCVRKWKNIEEGGWAEYSVRLSAVLDQAEKEAS